MKALKIIGIIILIVIVIVLILDIIAPKEKAITRSVIINKPSPQVYEFVKYLKNQEQYSKWVMADPNKKVELTGTDGTAGAVYAWNSKDNKVGEGEQQIMRLTDGKEVDCEVRFKRPMQNTARTVMTTEAISPVQTKVSWTFYSVNAFPMRFMNLFVDKILGPDMQTSLNNLKAVLEK